MYAPEQAVIAEKKMAELSTASDPRGVRQRFSRRSTPVPSMRRSREVSKAPRENSEQLYLMIAQAARAGDMARARQILKDSILNPQQQQEALSNIEQQIIQIDAAQEQIEASAEGHRESAHAEERAMMLTQIANQIGPGLKRAQALNVLEQARSMLGTSPRVENQEQMGALLEIARAFSRHDSSAPLK